MHNMSCITPLTVCIMYNYGSSSLLNIPEHLELSILCMLDKQQSCTHTRFTLPEAGQYEGVIVGYNACMTFTVLD